MTALVADVQVCLGDLDLRAAFDVAPGELVAVLGPNGAGKTTLLRAIAGLQPLDGGRVLLGGRVVDEPASGTYLPPAARSIGLVPQDHLLFPHLDALANVAFGLRARGTGRARAEEIAADWLARLGVGDAATLRPGALSGGQAQRVALARALAPEPAVLLLDEPLAALDASARSHVRAELRRHLADFYGARVLVTHDPLDALVLADRLVVLEGGRVRQAGTPAEVARRPASRFVADLVGVNLLHGSANGEQTVRLDAGGELAIADPVPPGPVAVAVRPQAVTLHRARPEGSARNTWSAEVVAVEPVDGRARVTLGGPVPLVAEVTTAAVLELDLVPGGVIWASVKAVDLECYER